VRLLAVLILAASAVDPVMYAARWAWSAGTGAPLPADFIESSPFQLVSLAIVALSAGLWFTARSTRVSSGRLIAVGLAYEFLICADISVRSNWLHFASNGTLPNLTWVPAVVILFPLVLPGPPRRMLAGAIASAATAPIAIVVLDRLGVVRANADAVVQASVSAIIAVGFSWMGARVIYGLGRELAAARELGAYRLEEKLGEGGMGEVWRARHRLLARPAAIKLIRRPDASGAGPAASPQAIARFEREARATAMLCSPHTVKLFDFGMAQDGTFYYVMELLDGLDASTLVRRFGPLPPARVVFLLRQVCHSLSEAESVGLVHRDIKPANLFVCRYGEDHDFAKVLDFGLVKALAGEPHGEVGLTEDRVVQGTPAFIAPEQAMGHGSLDSRVDLYALGCVAYWLLTGHLVFDAASPSAQLVHHASTPPAAPSTRSEMPIPAALDRLVLDCLEKDPAMRPQSARELSQRLADTCAPGDWTNDHAREWWSRHLPARG